MDWQTTFSSLDVSNQNYDWAGEDIDLTDDGGAIIAVDNGRFGFKNRQCSKFIKW